MCPQDLSVLVALSSSPLVCTFHILVFFIRKISPLKVVDVLQTKPMPFFNIKFITLHCTSKFTSSQLPTCCHWPDRQYTVCFRCHLPAGQTQRAAGRVYFQALIKSTLGHANESLVTLSGVWYGPQFTFGQFLGPTARSLADTQTVRGHSVVVWEKKG